MIPILLTHVANTTCTINGQTYTGDECVAIGTAAGVGALVVALFIMIFVLAITLGTALLVFWVITLVHVISHEDVPDRVVWIVLHFIGLGLLAAPVYYFAVMRSYNKKHNKNKKA